jgi:hypothetical protein
MVTILLITTSDVCCDLFHQFIADDIAADSLSGLLEFVVYPADAAFSVPLWLLTTTATPAAPPPTSTAAAMARRSCMDVRRLPRLFRFIIDASYTWTSPARRAR